MVLSASLQNRIHCCGPRLWFYFVADETNIAIQMDYDSLNITTRSFVVYENLQLLWIMIFIHDTVIAFCVLKSIFITATFYIDQYVFLLSPGCVRLFE